MRAFTVVHDDAAIVVVDKAAGVLTVPTARRERNTLVDLVGKHVRRELLVVHRLDRDTSGLLVFAKDRRALGALVDGWSEHERVYAAIVDGIVVKDAGTIESRLVTTKNLDRRSARPSDRARGRGDVGERAVTRYAVVERVWRATLVDVALETGRRNQIRVHMKELGHPILGDDRYARDVAVHPLWRGGLALHAKKLVVTHPVTRERLAFDTGLPEAFARFLEQARRKRG